MNHILSELEWASLSEKLGSKPTNELHKKAAEACIYRHSHRHSAINRSFGWHLLPKDFELNAGSANRLFREWSKDGKWLAFWDGLLELRCGVQAPKKPSKRLKNLDPTHALTLELQRAYDWFNRRFLAGKLPKMVCITIDTRSKGVFGYTYFSKVWLTGESGNTFHIAVTDKVIECGTIQVLSTLLHEMAHVYNSSLGIDDTDGRTQYHTQDFRDVALILGLETEKRHITKGYSRTHLANRGLSAIEKLKPVESVYGLRFKSIKPLPPNLSSKR